MSLATRISNMIFQEVSESDERVRRKESRVADIVVKYSSSQMNRVVSQFFRLVVSLVFISLDAPDAILHSSVESLDM